MSLRSLRLKTKFAFVALAAVILIPSPRAVAGDWRVHEADMVGFQVKMKSLQKEIQELVEQRKKTDVADDAKKINDEISAKYAELKQTNKDYDIEQLHMRFQHPEKGDLAERKYPRHPLASLKDLEGDLSLDGQLDRMRIKLTNVYGLEPIHKGPAKGESKDEAESRFPASVNAETDLRITLKK
jgi:hypothetical protein